MIIACTSTFYNNLSGLSKKRKDQYYSCLDDILAEFEGKTLLEISQLGDALNREILPLNCHYRKIRINNSARNEGARGSFRLFCTCFIDMDSIILLNVYPKTGRLAEEDPGVSGKIKLIEEMVAEKDNYYFLDRETKTFKKRENIESLIEQPESQSLLYGRASVL